MFGYAVNCYICYMGKYRKLTQVVSTFFRAEPEKKPLSGMLEYCKNIALLNENKR